MEKALANVIIKNGLSKVDEIWGSEVSLYSVDLFAGTTDLVGSHENKSAIMDFKNSLREKTKEMIEDYFLQCCAYKIAHDEMYNTDIERFVIMMATRNAKYQEFIIEGNEIKEYTYKWLIRLENYYQNFGK
jgi:genome maintenance exonuclease 1